MRVGKDQMLELYDIEVDTENCLHVPSIISVSKARDLR